MSRRQKKAEKEPNLERWLVSYADFITLLFAVFVTLYAMGQVDKQKAEKVMRSINESFGLGQLTPEPVPLPLAPPSGVITPIFIAATAEAANTGKRLHARREDLFTIKAKIEKLLHAAGLEGAVSLDIDQRGLVVSLEATSFFDSGSAQVRPEALPYLGRVAGILALYANPIRVEGFTDNLPIRSAEFPSNWELSTARATSLVHYLIDRHGIDPECLSATGYGEYRPRADNTTEEGRRQNRRVDLVMVAGPSESDQP